MSRKQTKSSRRKKKLIVASLVGRKIGRRRRQKSNGLSMRGVLLLAITIVVLFWFIRSDVHLPEFDFFSLFADERQEIVLSDDFYEQVEHLSLLYDEGRDVYYVEIITISGDDWDEERLDIGGHDHLDRTLPITAFLSERNVGRSSSRSAQNHEPTGWNQNRFDIDGTSTWIQNRGHLIAYTLTFNFNEQGEFAYGYLGSENDDWNLFTQTAHSNQNVMTRYEDQIREVLIDGGEVVFMASPIFRDDELMARGIWLQAVSTCDEFVLSVFIFNRQPGVEFDYLTGENWLVN